MVAHGLARPPHVLASVPPPSTKNPSVSLVVLLSQVARDRAAAAPFDGPKERVAVLERTDGAHEVASAWVFDLDHVGAPFAEQAGAERCADAGADVDDAQPFERRSAHFLYGEEDRRSSFAVSAVSVLDAY